MTTPPAAVFSGYLTLLKGLLVDALNNTFGPSYINPLFSSIKASIEYPATPQDYPSVWVDYDDTAPLTIAGIKHREYVDPDTGQPRLLTRWEFQGYASFTCVALSSEERDRLYDELIRVMAFGELGAVPQFRQEIENNDMIGINFNFDTIDVRGNAAAPGTPWGSNEYIYEKTINMECRGEFVSDGYTATLVNLSQIKVEPYILDTMPQPFPDDGKGGWQ